MSKSAISPLLAIASLALACSNDDACGPGLSYADGACITGGTSGSGNPGSGGTSASSASGGTNATAGDATIPDGFGAICEVHEDCTGQANYCAHSPVDPNPYCTASGCDADPSVCPSGWPCFNVGQFSPGEPYVCAKPASP